MTIRYDPVSGLYLRPTPAGAYYAVSGPEPTPVRRLLNAMLELGWTPPLEPPRLQRWVGAADEQAGLAVLHQAQEDGLIEGITQPLVADTASLEAVLSRLLGTLSSTGQALLADSQGFTVSYEGFDGPTSDFLAAVSADLASLHERHGPALHAATGSETSAWALVDAVGNSRVGFWPLFVGTHRFVLALGGLPRLNHPDLTDLVWALVTRYGGKDLA